MPNKANYAKRGLIYQPPNTHLDIVGKTMTLSNNNNNDNEPCCLATQTNTRAHNESTAKWICNFLTKDQTGEPLTT